MRKLTIGLNGTCSSSMDMHYENLGNGFPQLELKAERHTEYGLTPSTTPPPRSGDIRNESGKYPESFPGYVKNHESVEELFLVGSRSAKRTEDRGPYFGLTVCEERGIRSLQQVPISGWRGGVSSCLV